MNAEVLLPEGEDMRLAKVIRSNVDSDGKFIGDYNNIPTLNTILYDVQFPDGAIKPYSANLIAENILIQVDADGYHRQSLEGILDHSSDNRAVEKKKMDCFQTWKTFNVENYCWMEIPCEMERWHHYLDITQVFERI